MSKSPKVAILLTALSLIASPAFAGKYGLGREATPAELAAWDIDVRPDGKGLPEGQGSVAEGEDIYLEKCAACHGDFGEGIGRWPVLAGGHDTLKSQHPMKTIGSYWPYLSTAFDYIHRAMPFGNAQTLASDETYAIIAYLLNMNDLVGQDFVLSDKNFALVRLPNEKNFIEGRRARDKVKQASEPCMRNCKEHVEITKRARVIDVTPSEEEAAAAQTN